MEEGFFVSYDFMSAMFFLIIGFILVWTLVGHKVRLDRIYADIYRKESYGSITEYYRNFLIKDDLWQLKEDIRSLMKEYKKEGEE